MGFSPAMYRCRPATQSKYNSEHTFILCQVSKNYYIITSVLVSLKSGIIFSKNPNEINQEVQAHDFSIDEFEKKYQTGIHPPAGNAAIIFKKQK